MWLIAVALLATTIPFVMWRAFVSRPDGAPSLRTALVASAVAAAIVGVAHLRAVRWVGAVGVITMAIGAVVAALNSDVSSSRLLDDAFWRGHFVIMAGSLVLAFAIRRAHLIPGWASASAFVLSWAFLGAWGVGLAWMAWCLAIRPPGDRGR